MLFLVIFYVYPLRFPTGLFMDGVVAERFGSVVEWKVSDAQMPALMLIYALGIAPLYLIFAVMHVRALRLRDVLELTPLEVLLTQSCIRAFTVIVAVGRVSAVLTRRAVDLAGLA